MTAKDYTITTWANGFGVWHARADFPYGCGNAGEGERLLANARRAARRRILHEIAIREACAGTTVSVVMRELSPELRLEVVANRDRPSSGALASITWAEK